MLNIGLLVQPDRILENWEHRIFIALKSDPGINVSVIGYDGSGIFRDIKPKRLLYRFFLKLIKRFERQFTLGDLNLSPVTARMLFPEACFVPLKTIKKEYVDFVNLDGRDDSVICDCDLVLRHDFGILKGNILEAFKFGVWSFHHADNRVNRGGPAGFWEVFNRDEQSGVTLQVLNESLDGGLILKRGSFNTRKYWFENREFLLEGSVDVILAAIEDLKNGIYNPEISQVYSSPLYRYPSLSQLFRYLLKSQFCMIRRRVRRRFNASNYPLHVRRSVWNLGFISSEHRNTLYKVKLLEQPKNEFWADPFLCKYGKSDLYVFFEAYSYQNRYANISVGRFENGKLVDVRTALDIGSHLSYPFIYEEDGVHYMIPESSATKSVDVYRCVEFPSNWVKDKTILSNVSAADATLIEHDGYVWLFVNIASNKFSDHNSCLYIYRSSSYQFDDLLPHKRNPVIINSDGARSAGRIFYDESYDSFIRPCQRNIKGIYGFGVSLRKICKLSIDDYEEEEVANISPNFMADINGVHHIDVGDDYVFVDVCTASRL